MNDDLKDTTALSTPPTLVGNPEVIRQAQWLLEQTQRGHIIGFTSAAILADGNVAYTHALPQVPNIFQLAIGGLHVLISDLTDVVKQMRQQSSVSRILRPGRLNG